MKRSKALSLIVNQLDFLNGDFKGARDDFSGDELKRADVILTTLEDAGMLPNSVRLYATGEFIFSGDLIECANMDCGFEWEPEDT